MKNKYKNRKKGFTLIELIVVVSIVLILSGILVPKVLGYQDKAKKAKVVNIARQIYDASMADYTEEEGTFTDTKLNNSIRTVTDAAIPANGVVVGNDKKSATITFTSDGKTYVETITANENKFLVKDGEDEVYKNK